MTDRKRAAVVAALLALAALPAAAAPPTQWTSRGVGGGGALYSPSFSPFVPDEVYVACDLGAVFHSTDIGAHWSMLDFRRLQGSHETRVFFTSDPMIRYTIDFTDPIGVGWRTPVKSIDGGATWAALPGDPTGQGAWGMAVDPADANRVLVVDYNSLYYSGDGGQTFSGPKFTDMTGNGCFIAGAFFDGQNIYIGANAGILLSTDGGATFALQNVPGIPAGEGMSGFAGAKQGAILRFLGVFGVSIYNGITGGDHNSYRGVYTLDWGPSPAWVQATSGIAATDHPFFAGMMPADVATMYVAGGSSVGVPIVYKSTDGGRSWASTFRTPSNANIATGWSGDQGDRGWSFGEYALGFAVSPVDAGRAAFSDLGFVHTTRDGGATWRQAYVDQPDENPAGSPTPRDRYYHGIGLEQTTCWSLAWADPTTLFAGFSDIQGIRTTDGGLSWSFDYTGHNENTMYRVVVAPDGTLYGGTSTVHDMYQSTTLTDARIDGGRGRVLFSSDKGHTWQVLHDFGHPVVWVALDPTSPTRLYASVVNSAAGDVYVSNNIQAGGASTWSRLARPVRTEGHPFNLVVLDDGTLVATYSGRRASNAFTPSSGVFVSADGGLTWADRSDPGMRYWTWDLVVDPNDATQGTWYVGVFSGWGGPPNGLGGLYRSRDRGQTWARINASDRVTSAFFPPGRASEVWFTTEVFGMWYSEDANDAVPVWTQSEYPFRQPERVFLNPYDAGEVWVVSFGHGLMTARLAPAVTPLTLLRNEAVTQVQPVVPLLSTFLPVDPARDSYQPSFAPGDLDMDAAVIGDTGHPLAFYALDGPGVLRLVKTAAARLQGWF